MCTTLPGGMLLRCSVQCSHRSTQWHDNSCCKCHIFLSKWMNLVPDLLLLLHDCNHLQFSFCQNVHLACDTIKSLMVQDHYIKLILILQIQTNLFFRRQFFSALLSTMQSLCWRHVYLWDLRNVVGNHQSERDFIFGMYLIFNIPLVLFLIIY